MAHYLATRMQKNNTQNLGGMQKHNQREFENHSNKDIDKSRSYLNYDLVNDQNINYRERIMNTINEQRESEKKIRKDAVLCNEFFVTSGKAFFEELDEQEQRRFFEVSTEWFQERYGEQNVVFATVHNDETTPHMHIGVVPMRDGKLQSKNIFNRKGLLEVQEELPKFLEKKGFDIKRGEDRSTSHAVHVNPEDYKREQEQLRKEVLQLRREKEEIVPEVSNLAFKRDFLTQEINSLSEEKNSLEGENERFKRSLEFLNTEPIKKIPAGRRNKTTGQVEEDPNRVIISTEDYTKLSEVKRYNGVLVAENTQLTQENEGLKKRVSFLEKAHGEIKQTLTTARNKISRLVQNGEIFWNRAMSYAQGFRKDKDINAFNQNGIEDMFDDQLGQRDYQEWAQQNARYQRGAGRER